MDIQSFIQSGLLEAYVLGQGTAGERAEVERMAAAHPEVQAELEAIEQALEKLAMANAVPPPPGLKDKVLKQIQGDQGTPGIQDHLPPYGGGSGPVPQLKLKPWFGWLAAALLLGAFAVQLFHSNTESQRQNTRIAELETQVQDCQTQSQNQAKLQEIIALLRDRNTQTIVLADGPTPKITATVWYNPVRQESALDINSLPAPDPGRYFQLWAIVEGNPVPQSLGMVDSRDSWQPLPFKDKVAVFAISSEDKPEGNPSPTMVVMSGAVQG